MWQRWDPEVTRPRQKWGRRGPRGQGGAGAAAPRLTAPGAQLDSGGQHGQVTHPWPAAQAGHSPPELLQTKPEAERFQATPPRTDALQTLAGSFPTRQPSWEPGTPSLGTLVSHRLREGPMVTAPPSLLQHQPRTRIAGSGPSQARPSDAFRIYAPTTPLTLQPQGRSCNIISSDNLKRLKRISLKKQRPREAG